MSFIYLTNQSCQCPALVVAKKPVLVAPQQPVKAIVAKAGCKCRSTATKLAQLPQKTIVTQINRHHYHTKRIVTNENQHNTHVVNHVIKVNDIHHNRVEHVEGEKRVFNKQIEKTTVEHNEIRK